MWDFFFYSPLKICWGLKIKNKNVKIMLNMLIISGHHKGLPSLKLQHLPVDITQFEWSSVMSRVGHAGGAGWGFLSVKMGSFSAYIITFLSPFCFLFHLKEHVSNFSRLAGEKLIISLFFDTLTWHAPQHGPCHVHVGLPFTLVYIMQPPCVPLDHRYRH